MSQGKSDLNINSDDEAGGYLKRVGKGVAGATQAGKTTFTLNVLRNIDHLFEKPECKWNVYYFYHEDQPGFALIAKEKIDNSNEHVFY